MKLEETVWALNSEPLVDTKDFVVYKDKYPVTEGHLLFVPKVEDWEHLAKCYKAAYQWGFDWVQKGYCDAYNIGQNVGREAGQTIMYAHVHLIPRRKADMADPTGGVRHAIPGRGNYKANEDKERQEKLWAEEQARQQRFDF